MIHGGEGRRQRAAGRLPGKVDGVLREESRRLCLLLLRALPVPQEAGQLLPEDRLHPADVVPLGRRQLRRRRGAGAPRAPLQQQAILPDLLQDLSQQTPDPFVVRALAQLSRLRSRPY